MIKGCCALFSSVMDSVWLPTITLAFSPNWPPEGTSCSLPSTQTPPAVTHKNLTGHLSSAAETLQTLIPLSMIREKGNAIWSSCFKRCHRPDLGLWFTRRSSVLTIQMVISTWARLISLGTRLVAWVPIWLQGEWDQRMLKLVCSLIPLWTSRTFQEVCSGVKSPWSQLMGIMTLMITLRRWCKTIAWES